MPNIICRNCGHITNTALSSWVNSKDDMADTCHARLINNKWEEGCAYGKLNAFVRNYVDDLIREEDMASLRREANEVLFKEVGGGR